MIRHLSIALTALGLLASASAAQQYATQVFNIVQGPGSGLFNPASALGGPDFASSGFFSALSLGAQGEATFGFADAIRDGEGADFIVFENAFELLAAPAFTDPTGNSFAEVCFVEVSTNGIDFVRFPTSYSGPNAAHPVFGGSAIGAFDGFAGSGPVYADVGAGGISPLNAALAGGDAMDLADLAGEALVLSGLVDLQNINFVRLIDVLEGTQVDSLGRTIWDDRGNDVLDSADIDAICILNAASEASALQPTLSIEVDAANFLVVTLGDPQGLGAIDPASFVTSVNYKSFPVADFLSVFTVSAVSPQELTFTSIAPVTILPMEFVFGVYFENLSGKRVSLTRAVQF
jgi:hypothetical protein